MGTTLAMGRWLAFACVAAVLFVAIGVAWMATQWFVFGDSECDRGRCGPVGEFGESVGFGGLVAIWAAIAAVVAWTLTSRRRARRGDG